MDESERNEVTQHIVSEPMEVGNAGVVDDVEAMQQVEDLFEILRGGCHG